MEKIKRTATNISLKNIFGVKRAKKQHFSTLFRQINTKKLIHVSWQFRRINGRIILKVCRVKHREQGHIVWRNQQRAKGILNERKQRQGRDRRRFRLIVDNFWHYPGRIWRTNRQRQRQEEVCQGTVFFNYFFYSLFKVDIQNHVIVISLVTIY